MGMKPSPPEDAVSSAAQAASVSGTSVKSAAEKTTTAAKSNAGRGARLGILWQRKKRLTENQRKVEGRKREAGLLRPEDRAKGDCVFTNQRAFFAPGRAEGEIKANDKRERRKDRRKRIGD